jgi:lipopolysaccharide transport system ATP-binding protein
VAFAELEKFLDTPVKHYSSGMYIRLAFAVAAHLEPEILLVDEVLAVGDIAFQRKCLGKMHDVVQGGRTVVFVSHDMSAVSSLCQRSVLLHDGKILRIGPTADVIQYYLNSADNLYSPIRYQVQDRGELKLLSITAAQNDRQTTVVDCRQSFDIIIEYEILSHLKNSRLNLILRNQKGEVLFGTCDYDEPANGVLDRSPGRYRSRIEIGGKLMKSGSVFVTFLADIRGDRVVFASVDALALEVIDRESDAVAERSPRDGALAPILPWRLTRLESSDH